MNQQQQQQVRFIQNPIQAQNPILQDNITKTKNLLIPLNCALNNLFQVAAQQVRNEDKNPDNPSFEKYFEEFYSICDQIELNLNTALHCIKTTKLSSRNLPLPVTVLPQSNSMTYDQYLKTVKSHVDFYNDIQNIFTAED